MGLHRPWVPAHYLVHTAPLFKHKGRNMKHCFRRCLWVKKIFYLFLAWRRKPLDHFWSCGHTGRRWPWYKLKWARWVQSIYRRGRRFESNEPRLKDWLFLKLHKIKHSKGLIQWAHIRKWKDILMKILYSGHLSEGLSTVALYKMHLKPLMSRYPGTKADKMHCVKVCLCR